MSASTLDIFRALADEVRLRVLHALFTAELSVAELVQVLELPQSTVSRHLKPLRDAGLVETRREGTSVYYRRGGVLDDPVMTGMLEGRLKALPTAIDDQAGIRRVLELRKKRSHDFFERIAGRYGSLTQPGGGWSALAAGLAAGFAGRTVADIGAGEGQLTLILARFAREVIAVDQSAAMLREVRGMAETAGVGPRVRTAEGDLEELPLEDGSVDAVFLSQALHHGSQPPRAIQECGRILRDGGQLIILDLVKHEQEWVREEWADQWLGFDEHELSGWFDLAGMETICMERLPGATPELGVLLAVGRKQS